MNIFEIVQAVKNAKGSNNKIGLLNANSGNKILQKYLSTVYDTRLCFYVQKYEAGTPTKQEYDDTEIERMLDFVSALSERLLTGEAAQEAIKEFTGTLSEEGQELFASLIRRDIKAGVASGTLIKIWPNSIFIEPYQRCVLAKDTKSDIKGWGFYVSQLKADGSFASLNASDELHHCASRAGTIYPNSVPFMNLINEVRQKQDEIVFNEYKVKDCTIEGEFLVRVDGVILPREESNGMLNSLQQSGKELPENAELLYFIWDIVPTEKRKYKGSFGVGYKQRFEAIERLFSEGTLAFPIETKFFNSYEQCVEHFLEKINLGLEGTVIKHPNAIWEDGDNKLQIKMKIEAECELKIVGFNPAEKASKYEHLFGSLQLESEDGLLKVGCSSGLKDAVRAELHQIGDNLIGQLVTVRFNDILKPKENGSDCHSLFLPRFVELRLDKTTADSLPRIFDIFEDAKKK